eukprot:1196145-Prorocentrum_minimum.AAC.4
MDQATNFSTKTTSWKSSIAFLTSGERRILVARSELPVDDTLVGALLAHHMRRLDNSMSVMAQHWRPGGDNQRQGVPCVGLIKSVQKFYPYPCKKSIDSWGRGSYYISVAVVSWLVGAKTMAGVTVQIDVIKSDALAEVHRPSIAPGARVTFGKSAALSDILLEHPSISRAHAALTCTSSASGAVRFYLIDLNSTHGSWVDGQKLQPGVETEVKDGSIMRYGASTRVFKLRLSATEAGPANASPPEKECARIQNASSIDDSHSVPDESNHDDVSEGHLGEDAGEDAEVTAQGGVTLCAAEEETEELCGKLPGLEEYDSDNESSDSEPEQSRETAEQQPWTSNLVSRAPSIDVVSGALRMQDRCFMIRSYNYYHITAMEYLFFTAYLIACVEHVIKVNNHHSMPSCLISYQRFGHRPILTSKFQTNTTIWIVSGDFQPLVSLDDNKAPVAAPRQRRAFQESNGANYQSQDLADGKLKRPEAKHSTTIYDAEDKENNVPYDMVPSDSPAPSLEALKPQKTAVRDAFENELSGLLQRLTLKNKKGGTQSDKAAVSTRPLAWAAVVDTCELLREEGLRAIMGLTNLPEIMPMHVVVPSTVVR